jgi:hypothetical protein
MLRLASAPKLKIPKILYLNQHRPCEGEGPYHLYAEVLWALAFARAKLVRVGAIGMCSNSANQLDCTFRAS